MGAPRTFELTSVGCKTAAAVDLDELEQVTDANSSTVDFEWWICAGARLEFPYVGARLPEGVEPTAAACADRLETAQINEIPPKDGLNLCMYTDEGAIGAVQVAEYRPEDGLVVAVAQAWTVD